MSFNEQLERLTSAINRKRGGALGYEVVVKTQDLRELIFQFNRVDKELREYKQNSEQKEFEYRSKCQNILSTERVAADKVDKNYVLLKENIKPEYISAFKVAGYESDGRE